MLVTLIFADCIVSRITPMLFLSKGFVYFKKNIQLVANLIYTDAI